MAASMALGDLAVDSLPRAPLGPPPRPPGCSLELGSSFHADSHSRRGRPAPALLTRQPRRRRRGLVVFELGEQYEEGFDDVRALPLHGMRIAHSSVRPRREVKAFRRPHGGLHHLSSLDARAQAWADEECSLWAISYGQKNIVTSEYGQYISDRSILHLYIYVNGNLTLQQLINYFTCKAARTVLRQLHEMNPPSYMWLYEIINRLMVNTFSAYWQRKSKIWQKSDDNTLSSIRQMD
ncbi:RbcX protein [Musa troglodytarum]|uniref:RbcX protein n=1 Tax=Musa troglodytarum TaxID=320322 RepID=A0A9E7FU15_9LILI|nr:RbcX protein [Musa troglodytarum]